MTYSYSVINPSGYKDVSKVKEKSALPGTILGLGAGAAAGGFIGYKKNFISDKTGIKNSFAKKVQDKLLNDAGDTAKNIHKQREIIIKKLDKIKTPEDLKELFSKNKDAAQDMCSKFKKSLDEIMQTITKENLKENKKTFKNWFIAERNNDFQSIKNIVQYCWDKDGKNFVKPSAIKDNVYNAILSAQKKVKTATILKYAAITGAVGAAIGFIINKFLN